MKLFNFLVLISLISFSTTSCVTDPVEEEAITTVEEKKDSVKLSDIARDATVLISRYYKLRMVGTDFWLNKEGIFEEYEEYEEQNVFIIPVQGSGVVFTDGKKQRILTARHVVDKEMALASILAKNEDLLNVAAELLREQGWPEDLLDIETVFSYANRVFELIPLQEGHIILPEESEVEYDDAIKFDPGATPAMAHEFKRLQLGGENFDYAIIAPKNERKFKPKAAVKLDYLASNVDLNNLSNKSNLEIYSTGFPVGEKFSLTPVFGTGELARFTGESIFVDMSSARFGSSGGIVFTDKQILGIIFRYENIKNTTDQANANIVVLPAPFFWYKLQKSFS